MPLIRNATVEIAPLPEDTDGMNVFQDPEGKFHKIQGVGFLTEPPPRGHRNILAIRVEIAGRTRTLYQAVTPDMVEGLFWGK